MLPDEQNIKSMFWSDASGWHQNELSAATGGRAPLSGVNGAGGVCGYVFDADNTQHVFCRGIIEKAIS
jgi:hypothetical protein